jgi:hypothetical protein
MLTRPQPLLCLERFVLPPESAWGRGSCVFSSLIKTSGWWIRGHTDTFDPPPAPARLLQADASEQEARGRAGNENQAPDQDLAAAEVRHKQAVVYERAKDEREGAGNGSGNTKGPQRIAASAVIVITRPLSLLDWAASHRRTNSECAW